MVAGFIDPRETPYNAAGDGESDDSAALNRALAACAEGGQDLWLPRGRYRVGATQIVIPPGVNIESFARLEPEGEPADRPLVVIGAPGRINERVQVTLAIDESSASSWGAADYVGIRIYNAQNCHFRIWFVRGFTIALELVAESELEAVNNLFEIGELSNARYRCQFNALEGGAVRDNLLLNGRLTVFNEQPVENCGWRITSADGSASGRCSNNLWIKPSFEADRVDDDGAFNFEWITAGPDNEVWWGRNETRMVVPPEAELVCEGPAAAGNLFWQGYFDGNPEHGIVYRDGAPEGGSAVVGRRRLVPRLNRIGGLGELP